MNMCCAHIMYTAVFGITTFIPTPLFVDAVRVLTASAFQTNRADYDMTKIEIMNYLLYFRKLLLFVQTQSINNSIILYYVMLYFIQKHK